MKNHQMLLGKAMRLHSYLLAKMLNAGQEVVLGARLLQSVMDLP